MPEVVCSLNVREYFCTTYSQTSQGEQVSVWVSTVVNNGEISIWTMGQKLSSQSIDFTRYSILHSRLVNYVPEVHPKCIPAHASLVRRGINNTVGSTLWSPGLLCLPHALTPEETKNDRLPGLASRDFRSGFTLSKTDASDVKENGLV